MSIVYANKFFAKNKKDLTEEQFIEYFDSNLRLNGYTIENEDIYDFVKRVYKIDNKEYVTWNRVFSKYPFNIIKKNTDVINNLPDERLLNYMMIMNEMHKRMNAIVHRTLPNVPASNKHGENTEYYDVLEKFNNLLEHDDEIVKKAEKDFEEAYGEYEKDEYLSSYYKKLLSKIRKSIYNLAKEKLTFEANKKVHIVNGMYIDHLRKTSLKLKTNRHSFIKRY